MRSLLRGRGPAATERDGSPIWKKRRVQLVLGAFGASVVGGLVAILTTGTGYATPSVTINSGSGATCFVTGVSGQCSYSKVQSALSASSGAATITLDVTGWKDGLAIDLDAPGGYEANGSDAIVLHGTTHLPQTGTDVPAQLSAYWPSSTADPELAFAVKLGDQDMSALNGLWDTPGLDLSLSGVVLATSPTDGYVLDGSQLPGHFLDGVAPMTLGTGLNMHADVTAGSDQPAAVANVLQYVGLTGDDGTSLDGTLGSTAGLLFDLDHLGDSGVDLTLTSSSTGDPLPSWISSRTSSLEFAIGDDGPRIDVTDELDTAIDGHENDFTGSATFDATSADKTTLSMTYGFSGAFDAPFGLDGLTVTDASLGLSLTTGDDPSFAGSMDVGVTIDTKPYTLHVDIEVASGLVSGTLGVNGDISVADAVDIGNALLGTDVAAPGGADDVSLTGATFSFSASTSPESLRFALEASTQLHGAAADALVSISKDGDEPVKFFAGMHVADLSIDDLVESPSAALEGLNFPNVDLFVSKGYVGDDGQPVDVNWDELLPAEQTFFAQVYGTADADHPDTVTFGANVVFDGTVTLPDSISSYFSTSDPLHLHGELGFGFDALGTGSPAKLAGSLTAELPGIRSDALPDWMQGSSWSLTIAADSNGAAQISLAGDVDAEVDGTSYPVSIEGKFTHTSEGTSIDLSGKLTGTFTNLFGLSWLAVTDPSVSLGIEHTSEGTHLSASLDADVTFGTAPHTYTVHVAAEISNADGTEASLEIQSAEDSTASVDLSALASFFGAGDVPSGQGSLTLTSIHGKATYSKTAGGTLDIVADTSLDLGGANSLDSELLLSIHHLTGSPTKVIFGFRTVNPVDLSDIVTTLPAGVDLHFDTLAVVVANPAMTIKASDMLPEEMNFFQPFCEDADSACHDQISLKSGINFVSATRVPESLSSLIGAVHVDPDAPVLVTGTIPVFGGSDFNLSVDLPSIDGAGNTPDFYQSGRLSLNVSTEGFSMTGHLTFNIPKKQATSESECTDLSGVWRAERGTGTMGCYDQVPFALTADIQLGDGPPSMMLTGGLDNNYIWHSPNGASWLELDAATIQFGITAGTPVEFTLGFRLAASVNLGTIADPDMHDFDGSMLLGIEPIEAPPFIAIDPKGFRVASGTGLSMADMVKLANLVAGTNLSLGSVPNIAVRNIEFAFAEEDDPALCLVQGIHIAGDLYINPTKDAHVISASSPCPTSASQEEDRTKICQDDSSNGCFAAADFAINKNGLHASGTVGAFDAGPLHFGGALVDLKVSPTDQHLVVHGDASIQDFASGQVDLLISRTLLHFRASASLFGTGLQAFLDGSATIPSFTSLADLEKGGSFAVTAVMKSDFLNKAAVAISGTLQQLKPALQAISAILEDLDQGHILTALTELPTKIAALGVDLPEPYGSAIKEISDKLTYIHDQIALFDHNVSWGIDQLLNGFTLSFPGIPGIETPETCITTWSGGSCWTTPPVDTFLGTIPGIPGVVVPATCITTTVNGTCYSVPPIDGVHIPGLCDDLHSLISAIPAPCDGTSISNTLLLPVLRTIIKQTSGYDIGNIDLHTVLTDITNAFGSGQTVSIDCAEFQASATIGATPSANVHLAADFNIFGNKLTAGVGWNFSSDSTNPATVVNNLIDAIIHPNVNLNDTCALPADWNTNADFPDMVGTAPAADDDTPPPTPTLALRFAHSTINEGSSASLTGTVTPTPSGSPTVTVNWGSGQSSSTATVNDGTFTVTHGYPNNTPAGQPSAQYNVTAEVTDGPSSSAVLTVANVAPASLVLTPSASSINEGSSVTMAGTFTDPGADTHTVSIDWGDDTPATSMSLNASVLSFTSPAHTYADNNGTDTGYTVTVTVTDQDVASVTRTTTVNVANVAPKSISVVQLCAPAAPATTPVACTDATTPEQQVQAFRFSFTDPGTVDTVTAVIDWGDGTPQQTVNLGTLRTFTAQHIWTEADTDAHPNGHFPVSVTLTDKDSGVGNGSLDEVVTNVAPTSLSACLLGTVDDGTGDTNPCPASATIDEGDTVSLFGGFQDVSALDDHTVTIDWGQGWPVATRYETQSLDVGVFSYTSSRAFGDEGTYQITVTVADDDGASVSFPVELTVRNVAPTATISHTGTYSVQGVDAFLGHAGHSMSFTGASADPGSDDLTLSWLWRDGSSTAHGFPDDPATDDETTPEDPTVDPKSFTDPENHTWAAPCVYQPQFSSTDGDVATPTRDSVDLVVTANDPTRYASGTWISTTKSKKPPATLPCYLKIVQRMSAVFTGPSSVPLTPGTVPLTTNAQALNIVQSSSSDARLKLERQVLTMWFDFANGGFDYTTMVDTDRDGRPDATFASAMQTAEQLILDPRSTQSQMLSYRNNLAPLTGD